VGANITWQRLIANIKSELLFSDGGGTTINHPIWSGLTQNQINEILDLDDTVLGIEIYNESCELDNSKGWALRLWDTILLTGRRCWGFAVPDWRHTLSEDWHGKIVMLVPKATQHECLRAIREGAFYCQIAHTDLKITSLIVSGRTITLSVNKSATIRAIVDWYEYASVSGSTITVTIPEHSVYCRFEIETANDSIYTNAIMFRTRIN
jgi:hypothetical protein